MICEGPGVCASVVDATVSLLSPVWGESVQDISSRCGAGAFDREVPWRVWRGLQSVHDQAVCGSGSSVEPWNWSSRFGVGLARGQVRGRWAAVRFLGGHVSLKEHASSAAGTSFDLQDGDLHRGRNDGAVAAAHGNWVQRAVWNVCGVERGHVQLCGRAYAGVGIVCLLVCAAGSDSWGVVEDRSQ